MERYARVKGGKIVCIPCAEKIWMVSGTRTCVVNLGNLTVHLNPYQRSSKELTYDTHILRKYK